MPLVINWGTGNCNGPIERLYINNDSLEIDRRGIFLIIARLAREEEDATNWEEPEEEPEVEKCLIVKIGHNGTNFVIKIIGSDLKQGESGEFESFINKEIIIFMPDDKNRTPEIITVP